MRTLCAFALAGAGILCALIAQEIPPNPYTQFADVTAQSGLAGFFNKQGTTRKDYIIESIGGGCAFLDYDGDGWLDVLLVKGSDLDTYNKRGGETVASLYRNNRDGGFSDVTANSGLAAPRGWGMGVTVADYDNDGNEDIFITGYGRNFLFRNNGDGTFAEVAQKAGVLSAGLWSTGAAFFDFDGDGFPDLYVSRYVKFDSRHPAPRSAACNFHGERVFCGPQGFSSDPHSLYRNNRDGTFSEVSADAGLRAPKGPFHGLGVLPFDYDNDGLTDIFVANDSTPNLLWRNLGNGKFRNVATESGVAYGTDGAELSSMGADAGDLANRGLADLFVTEFSGQGYEFFRHRPDHSFEDATWAAGFGATTLPYLGWSAHMADFDNDGWLDILAVNGHVYPEVDAHPIGTSYRQKLLLFRNLRNGRFDNIAAQVGPPFEARYAGRGAAIGDFDGDGWPDILINNIDGAPVLLKNRGIAGGTWLDVQLKGRKAKSALGAKVIISSGGIVQSREVRSASGYLSASSRRLHFGLSGQHRVDELIVVWPGGRKQILGNVRANQLLRIEEPL